MEHHPTNFKERSGLMQTAVTAKKPGNTAFSGHFRAGRTYRGRIKDDHKIDIKTPRLIQFNYSSADFAA